MLGSVFWKSLRDRRRALGWWSVGILAYTLFMDAFWPFVNEMRSELEQVIGSFPEGLLSVFGVEQGPDLFSPAGYLNSRSFGWVLPVVFALYASALGARAIAGEEEDNTMDLLLANPVSRSRVVVHKFAALATVLAWLGGVELVSLILGDAVFGLGIPAQNYAAATLSATLLGLVFGAVSFAAGGLGARRGLIVGLVAALAVGTFLLDSLSGLADWLDTARLLSPFYYYDASRPLVEGLNPLHALVLAVVALTGLVVAVIGFRRRDVTV